MTKRQSEYERARAWRESLKLSRPKLAAVTGYSVSAIVIMERGTGARGEPIEPAVFRRYKLACAAIAAGAANFDWGPVTMTISPSVELTEKL